MSTVSSELSSLSDPPSSPLPDLLSSPALYSFMQTLANDDNNDNNDDNIDEEINSPLYQSNLADRDRMNTTQKLEEVLNTLHRVGWSFQRFIKAWIGTSRKDGQDVRLRSRRYAKEDQRRRVLQEVLHEKAVQTALEIPELDTITGHITKELDGLIVKPLFGQFDHKTDVENIDFSDAFKVVRESAPV